MESGKSPATSLTKYPTSGFRLSPDCDGVGYGDSYILDPAGEIIVRSRRHQEDFIFADVDAKVTDNAWGVGRSRWSARKFGQLLIEAAAQKPHTDETSRRAHRVRLKSKA